MFHFDKPGFFAMLCPCICGGTSGGADEDIKCKSVWVWKIGTVVMHILHER